MKMKVPFSRRAFLKNTAACAAAAAAAPTILPGSVLGKDGAVAPSKRITVGCIGVGGHGIGRNLKTLLTLDDVRVAAVCDVDGRNLEKARGLVNEKYGSQDCAAYKDFREVLARPDVDAVMISTPDHWHTPISIMAAEAGKDVCCEKPTLTIGEGRVLCDVVKRYGRVFQTSTEDRSISIYHRMAELVRNGRIGELHTIRVRLPKQPGKPGDPTPTAVPSDFDYDMWLGPAPEAPYTKDRIHFHFRWLWDYSGGIITDWGTHLFDTAQWANDTERSGPVEIRGNATFWESGLYNTPKNYHVVYTYANGVRLIVEEGGTSIRCEGSEGWIESPHWRGSLRADPPSILTSVIRPDETHLFTCPEGEHRNFIDCVKTREEPYFPVEIGHRVSTVCHLGNIALRTGRRLQWDPVAEVFPHDAQANRFLRRSMRSPWRL